MSYTASSWPSGPSSEDQASLIAAYNRWEQSHANADTGFNVKDKQFAGGAKGDSVTDDTAAIQAAVNAANARGGIVFFPPGGYVVSNYIDVQSGFHWVGAGWQQVGAVGTTLIASGVGKGVLRFRPGTIGVEAPNDGAQGFVDGIAFTGGANSATTGHLVNLARVNGVRFINCSFSDTAGTGLKDDQVTSIAAHGVYCFGTEVVSFTNCQFANCTNATGGAIGYEKSNHGHYHNGCNFSNLNYGVHFIDGGTTPNGGIYFNGCFWVLQKTVFYLETAANANNVHCYGCWEEQGTATNPHAVWIDGTATARLFNWGAVSCVIKGGAGTILGTAGVTLDSSSWISCRFDTFTLVFNHASTNGDNVLIAPDSNTVTNLFTGGDPNTNGFVYSVGTSVNPAGAYAQNTRAVQNKLVTLTDGAFVSVNLSQGNDFVLSTSASRTINNYTVGPNPGYSQVFAVTIKNTSGGAITTTWSANFHFASAWADPGAGKQRTVLFRDGGGSIAYEIARNATDVTP